MPRFAKGLQPPRFLYRKKFIVSPLYVCTASWQCATLFLCTVFASSHSFSHPHSSFHSVDVVTAVGVVSVVVSVVVRLHVILFLIHDVIGAIKVVAVLISVAVRLHLIPLFIHPIQSILSMRLRRHRNSISSQRHQSPSKRRPHCALHSPSSSCRIPAKTSLHITQIHTISGPNTSTISSNHYECGTTLSFH